MFCKNCGKELNDDVSFCPNCGSKVSSPEVIIKTNSGESEAVTGFVLGLVSILFWVTIIIPILGLYFSSKGKNSAKANYAKAGKILSLISLIIPAIVSLVFLCVIGVKAVSEKRTVVTSIPIAEEYVTGQREIYDWYTTLGIIQAETCDNPPATVRVDISIAYNKNDEVTPIEIKQRTVEIKAFLRRFIKEKTAAELMNKDNEGVLENEIKNGLNDKVLSSSRIRDVVFQQKDVIQKK